MATLIYDWKDGRDFSEKALGSGNGAHAASNRHLLLGKLCAPRVGPNHPPEEELAELAVCSEQVKKIDIEKHVELSIDEAVALYAEMSAIMSALEDPHRETLKRLLKVIGTIAEYSATEKEVVSVARSTMAWLEKIDCDVVGKVTTESLIQFARLSSSGWRQAD